MLLITDGGLPALVACRIEADKRPLTLWLPPEGWPGIDGSGARIGPRHRRAAEAHARRFGARFVAGESTCRGQARSTGRTWDDARLLIEACQAAERLSCNEVVWPVVRGGEAEALASADEVCRCVNRLASAARESAGHEGVRLRAPLADLTERQVADLAFDMDVPVELCWWHAGHDESEPSGPAWQASAMWLPMIQDAAAECCLRPVAPPRVV